MDGKAKPFQKQSDDFTREVRREMEITVRDSLRESGSPPTPGAALPGSYTFLSPGPPYPGATLAGPRGRLRPTAPPTRNPLHHSHWSSPRLCGRGPAGRGQSPAPYTASKRWRPQEVRSELAPHGQEADSSHGSSARECPAPRERPVPQDRPTPTPASSQARGHSALPLAHRGVRGWAPF